jgi:epoxyqueuosine reductase QueG
MPLWDIGEEEKNRWRRWHDSHAPVGHRSRELLQEARSIVVAGIRMLDVPLDGLPQTRLKYTANFHLANSRLNQALFDMAALLQELGFKSFPLPYKEMPGWNLEKRSQASFKLLRSFLTTPGVRERVNALLWDRLSYRHLAVEAGLGELGLNNLLLTPEHGPLVRLIALVTDAELQPGSPIESYLCQPERCGYACVRACPVGALPREKTETDKAACLKYYVKLGIPGASGVRCGVCVAVCPAHRKNWAKER